MNQLTAEKYTVLAAIDEMLVVSPSFSSSNIIFTDSDAISM